MNRSLAAALRSVVRRSVLALVVLVAGLPVAVSPRLVPVDQVLLDGVPVDLTTDPQQVVTVNHTRGFHAHIVWWQLTADGWIPQAESDRGRIGYGGLVAGDQRIQGSGATPIGTYGLPFAFGRRPVRPEWKVAYRRFTRTDYWVGDNNSPFYNRFRNRAEGGFDWRDTRSRGNSSERLAAHRRQYEMAFATSYNYEEQVRHRGSAIFLHVNGRAATAGCVSAPRWFIADLMNRLDPGLRPVIAIGE